jgi:ubiquitin fusion degradation protein 1
METLVLEPGDLVNITSTELPLGTFVKFQPQDVSFLEISDPKAVLQRALESLSTLTKGDIFTFDYNDTIYRIAVLETKPENPKNSICIIDVDLNVDFAAPLGYEEPKRTSGTSTPRSATSGLPGAKGGVIHPEGSMAQSINYTSIAPKSKEGNAAHAVASSNFSGAGNRVAARKGKAAATPASTKSSTPDPEAKQPVAKGDAPFPLRLPPGKLFLGYEIKPVKKKEGETVTKEPVHFQGQGNTLRKKKKEGDNDS